MTQQSDSQTDSQVDPVVPAASAARNRRTRVAVALLAVVVLLGGAGAAAAWALTGDDAGVSDQVQAQPNASVAPSATSTSTATAGPGSPTAEVLGRNVFAPLVDTVAVEGVPGDGDVPGSVEIIAAEPTPAGPTVAPDPGEFTVPADPVTVTRTQLGPTTTVPGPTQTVAGPTTTVPGPTQTVAGPTTTVAGPPTTVTTTTGFAHVVTVAGVSDAAADDSQATFVVNGASSTVPVNAAFGDVFTYVDYNASTGLLSFTYGTTLVQAAVGRTLGLQ